jgi:predicted lipoprotein
LTNALVRQAEILKTDQLGVPLGDATGGPVLPDQVPYYRSGWAGPFMQAELRALEATFNGNLAGTAPAIGFDDLLKHLAMDAPGATPLATQISTQITTCQQHLAAIPAPFDQSLTQDPAPARTLQAAVQQVVVLLKVDFLSRIGVSLTFTDGDGD